METGRKFWVTLLGMLIVATLPLVSHSPEVGTAISAVGAMVLAFSTANAAVSWAYARQDATSRQLTGQSDIERRRDAAAGMDPAP